jgi:tetratricopeptide (TPR) repeat protein
MIQDKEVQSQTPVASPKVGRYPAALHSPAFICLLLALGTLWIYGTAARNDFVNYDDPDYVTSNAQVQAGLTWANIRWAFTTGHASNWHPLTWISHMIDCQLFGQKPGPQHLMSVAFHVGNALLLFLVLRRMTGAHWQSAFVAALFALHPLHVESVAWISERKDVLSTFFLMLTLAAYTGYVERNTIHEEQAEVHKPPVRRGPRDRAPKTSVTNPKPRESGNKLQLSASTFYVLALAFFALGLMSKPMLVTVPFLLVLLDYWPFKRFALGAQPSHEKQVFRLVLEKIPFLALSILSSLVTYLVQQKGGAVSTSLSLGGRISNALVSYVRYMGKMVWPQDLSVLYPHPGHWPVWQLAAAGLLLAIISAVVCSLIYRRPEFAVGWFWYLGTLIPVIGLVQVGIQSMADRYSYIPLIGLFILVSWGAADCFSHKSWGPPVLASLAGLTLIACAVLTVQQIEFWHNSETLFSHAVQVTSKNYLAYNNLGFFQSGQGKIDEAMENYRRALEINPLYEDALNNMGYALAGRKRHAEAIPFYEAALRIKTNHVEVHNNLGNALSEIGKIPEAMEHYRYVLSQNPEHADAHNNLGIALAMQGKLDEALSHFRAAIRFKPNYASAHSNLGNGLAAQRKFDEAMVEYQESLRLNPRDAQAHNNLGNVFAELNRVDDAIEQYSEAIRLNADNPEAHFNLGLALAKQGKTNEAAAHYREALRLKPDYADAQKQLMKTSN